MEHRLSARAGIALAGVAVAAFGLGTTATIGHAESNIPGINSCPNGNVYVAEYEGGNPEFVGTSATQNVIELAAKDADGNPSGSNVGDTVIVCPGTYYGTNVSVPKGPGDDSTTGATGGSPSDTTKDNVTIRSFSGPGNTIVVTDGKGDPAFTVDANGVTIGGPGLGFTIENPATTGTAANPLTPSPLLIEVGTPGAQSTSNEDEQCMTNGVVTASGCDQNAPAYVAINDRVVDNKFSNLVPQGSSFGSITGIELDNTINNTIESNLFTNDVPDHATVGALNAIVVGTNFGGTGNTDCTKPSATPCNGYSTNINTALFQNAFRQAIQGGNGSCTSVTGIALDGWVLDSQVYNNLIQQLVSNSNTKCAVTGIESDAFGQLENEQTGTLVPTNGNIDNNTIGQLGPAPRTGTGILLDPTPPAAGTEPGQVLSQNPPAGPFCENGTTSVNGSCPGEAAPPSSYTVQDNLIQSVNTAVSVADPLGSNSYAHDNNFQNDVVGINDTALGPPPAAGGPAPAVSFDGTNNFWGCDDGPAPTAADADDNSCAKIAGPVFYNPWLASPVAQAGDEAGDNAGH